LDESKRVIQRIKSVKRSKKKKRNMKRKHSFSSDIKIQKRKEILKNMLFVKTR